MPQLDNVIGKSVFDLKAGELCVKQVMAQRADEVRCKGMAYPRPALHAVHPAAALRGSGHCASGNGP
jgi:hypothetical protein